MLPGAATAKVVASEILGRALLHQPRLGSCKGSAGNFLPLPAAAALVGRAASPRDCDNLIRTRWEAGCPGAALSSAGHQSSSESPADLWLSLPSSGGKGQVVEDRKKSRPFQGLLRRGSPASPVLGRYNRSRLPFSDRSSYGWKSQAFPVWEQSSHSAKPPASNKAS